MKEEEEEEGEREQEKEATKKKKGRRNRWEHREVVETEDKCGWVRQSLQRVFLNVSTFENKN